MENFIFYVVNAIILIQCSPDLQLRFLALIKKAYLGISQVSMTGIFCENKERLIAYGLFDTKYSN